MSGDRVASSIRQEVCKTNAEGATKGGDERARRKSGWMCGSNGCKCKRNESSVFGDMTSVTVSKPCLLDCPLQPRASAILLRCQICASPSCELLHPQHNNRRAKHLVTSQQPGNFTSKNPEPSSRAPMERRGGGGGRKTLLAPIHFIFSLLQKRSTVSIWLYENLRTRIQGKIRVRNPVQ